MKKLTKKEKATMTPVALVIATLEEQSGIDYGFTSRLNDVGRKDAARKIVKWLEANENIGLTEEVAEEEILMQLDAQAAQWPHNNK